MNRRNILSFLSGVLVAMAVAGCSQEPEVVGDYDVIIRGGSIYDGHGGSDLCEARIDNSRPCAIMRVPAIIGSKQKWR